MFKNFLMKYWLVILVITAFIGYLIYLWFTGKREIVKAIIYSLVCSAEQAFGSGTGLAKFGYVLQKLYSTLPWVVKTVFMPVARRYIEDQLKKMKLDLQNGMNLSDLKTEQYIAMQYGKEGD